MPTMTRSRTARCLGALIGAAALVAALPAPALAKDRHHDDRGYGRDHDRDHGRGHASGRGHDRDGRGRYVVYTAPRFVPAPPRWRGARSHYTPAYYCGRCRTHFASYQGLTGHVHYQHRVPTWQVPGVLAQVSFGWTFGF